MKSQSYKPSPSKEPFTALQNSLSESDIQIQVVEYVSLLVAQCHFTFFSVPGEAMGQANTGSGIGRMVRLKKMGLRPGAADLVFVKYGKAYFLEMKRPGEKQSENQKLFQIDAVRCGAMYAVADSFELAIKILRGWKIILT